MMARVAESRKVELVAATMFETCHHAMAFDSTDIPEALREWYRRRARIVLQRLADAS